jgi:hypothetical protein
VSQLWHSFSRELSRALLRKSAFFSQVDYFRTARNAERSLPSGLVGTDLARFPEARLDTLILSDTLLRCAS